MGKFTYAGQTIVAPGVLVQTIVGANTVLSLLPFGTIMFAGPSDGGSGFYRFNDLYSARKVLRSGPLLNAIKNATRAGGSAGFLAVVLGTKTASALALGSSNATLTSGDVGLWTTGITYTSVAGSTTGSAVTITYPDPVTGNAVVIGGLGTAYDNLTAYSQLANVMANDAVMTPPSSTGLPPIAKIVVTSDAAIATVSTSPLTGGSGTGAYVPVLSDVVTGLGAIEGEAFDIGHLVGVYDASSQAYANGKAMAHGPFGNLQRFIHQVRPSGLSASLTRQVNSAAMANYAIGAATAMNYFRASIVPQQIYAADIDSGIISLMDAAPFLCGLAAGVGASDQWGPSSPLTRVPIPGAIDVDYRILKGTGDLDNAILGGVWCLETKGIPSPGAVRSVQSVTTQPVNPVGGQAWILAEFSGVRGSDALLANMKAAVETSQPRAIGGGNTIGTANGILAECRDVLVSALAASWITQYDKNSIVLGTLGSTGSDDQLQYAATITPPLNHLGITQYLTPYSYKISLGNQVSSS